MAPPSHRTGCSVSEAAAATIFLPTPDRGLVAEAMQFSLLCEHRARHVWRSHAFATLYADYAAIGGGGAEQVTPSDFTVLIMNMRNRN